MSERQKRVAARQEQLQNRLPKPQTVRVEPASDELRNCLKHPGGIAFPASGAAEWPLDRFTRRRIADGSVKIATAAPPAPSAPRHQRHHRSDAD